MRCASCEDQVSFLKIEDIQHVARRFPYQHHGLIMNQMQFNETVNKHMQSATLPKHHPEEVELNPWDFAEEEAVEIEILEGMRYIKAPPQIVNQQLSQMVYIGDGQYVPKEDADSEFLAKVRAKMEAARDDQAALAGRPSSSGVRSTPQKLTKEQIMSASPYGQDSTLQIVAKDHKGLEETRKRKAKEDAEAKAAEEAQAALDEQAALAGRPTPMQPAKLRVLPPITPKEKKRCWNPSLASTAPMTMPSSIACPKEPWPALKGPASSTRRTISGWLHASRATLGPLPACP